MKDALKEFFKTERRIRLSIRFGGLNELYRKTIGKICKVFCREVHKK
jgi:hypothetical protein